MKTKKWILLMLIIIGTACNPYPRLQKPVKMKYCVNLIDNGSLLCRDYKVNADTTFIFDAGYYKKMINQRHVTDLILIGKWNMMIVPLKK